MPYIVKQFSPVKNPDRKVHQSLAEAEMEQGVQSGLTPEAIFEVFQTDAEGVERELVTNPRARVKELVSKFTVAAGELGGIMNSMRDALSETREGEGDGSTVSERAAVVDRERLLALVEQASAWVEDMKNRLK